MTHAVRHAPMLGRLACAFVFAFGAAYAAAAPLPADTAAAIDAIVEKALRDPGTPSVSLAVVKDGEVAYARAYGMAKLSPAVPATAEMRYKIASNSKHVTAAAILLLAEEGKLSLDDKVARYVPQVTRAKDVTIRNLLTHTSGYQDYYAIDYLANYSKLDVTPQGILQRWAMLPKLDFEPGSRYQYSNTNYTILGLIVEKLTGRPLMTVLRTRLFGKVGMPTAIDASVEPWSAADPIGYTRYALGPVREVAPEAKGWMWAMGGLAMSAGDLARWDIALMDGKLLKPGSMRTLTAAMNLTGGSSSGYGLGLNVSQMANGHRRWAHTGGASGFLSVNTMYPDDRMAITVLTNGEGRAFTSVAAEIEKLLITSKMDPEAAPALERAKALFAGLQKGQLDRAAVTEDLAGYFTPVALSDFTASLGTLGEPTAFTQTSRSERGGMVYRTYTIKTASKSLRLAAFVMPDGRFDQFLVSEAPQ
jgi:D-alanyl-D-alanine carboxypeptidase